jgi:hypothetical protein
MSRRDPEDKIIFTLVIFGLIAIAMLVWRLTIILSE